VAQPTTALAERQSEFAGFLMKGFPKLALIGLPARSAAALAGNATQENLCRAVTTGALDHGSQGVMQWRLERLSDMQSFCVSNFGRWDTLEAQAAFCLYELNRDYPTLDRQLHLGVLSLETLTANVCATYERPAAASAGLGFVPGQGEGREGRINYAYDTFALLQDAPKVTPQITTSSAGAAAVVVVAAGAAGTAHWFGGAWWIAALIVVAGAIALGAIYLHFKKRAVAPPSPSASASPAPRPAPTVLPPASKP
jgi:hypothetical protein